MSKSALDRINAIASVLERLATDVEVIREGTEIIMAALPAGCEVQYCLLREQAAALERISMGMVQVTAENLGKLFGDCREYSHSPPATQETP